MGDSSSVRGFLAVSVDDIARFAAETLPLLLVTDLAPREIIGGKALGILWRARGLILLPLVHAACISLFRLTGWITPVFLFLDLVVFGGFVLACSLIFSLYGRKTSRAMFWSQLVLLLVAFLMPLPLGLFLGWMPRGERVLFLYPGIWVAASVQPLDGSFGENAPGIAHLNDLGGYIGYGACLALYAVLAVLLLVVTLRRFEVVARRE